MLVFQGTGTRPLGAELAQHAVLFLAELGAPFRVAALAGSCRSSPLPPRPIFSAVSAAVAKHRVDNPPRFGIFGERPGEESMAHDVGAGGAGGKLVIRNIGLMLSGDIDNEDSGRRCAGRHGWPDRRDRPRKSDLDSGRQGHCRCRRLCPRPRPDRQPCIRWLATGRRARTSWGWIDAPPASMAGSPP